MLWAVSGRRWASRRQAAVSVARVSPAQQAHGNRGDRRASPLSGTRRWLWRPTDFRRRRGRAKLTVQTRPRLFPLVRPAEPAGES